MCFAAIKGCIIFSVKTTSIREGKTTLIAADEADFEMECLVGRRSIPMSACRRRYAARLLASGWGATNAGGSLKLDQDNAAPRDLAQGLKIVFTSRPN
ncbi:hypothetical protein DXT93_30010 [Agrobacterium rhizogenes]|nr:hypothetical protein [Rhizobium rhizogenes]